MRLIRTLALSLGGVALAGAAFVHAASESTPVMAAQMNLPTTSLTAQINSDLADAAFRLFVAQSAEAGDTDPQGAPADVVAKARAAFAVDPTESIVMRILSVGGTPDEATRAAALDQVWRVTKRDALVTLWLAQYAGSQEDIDGMVDRFDAALRTSERTRERSLGPLLQVLAVDEGVEKLGELVAQGPNWEADFWHAFVRNPIALARAQVFFEQSGLSIDRVPSEDRTDLYANLTAAGQFDALYAQAGSDSEVGPAGSLAEGTFSAEREGHPLDWVTRSDGNFSTDLGRSGGQLLIDAEPGSFGDAAQRVIRNPRGGTLEMALADGVPDGARLTLTAGCAGVRDSRLAQIVLNEGQQSGSATLGSADCGFRRLNLA